MQVAVFEAEASSAALGAQEALEVTMTSDASFMTMMFSNLYTNQVLAAIREPICNAWDAMIDAGKADEYIDITYDRETGDLSIRDYGKGIHKDKIAKIYGVFGSSTKRTDSKTTGGFGLGSKAPWALVESFRVTSRHEGNMSVYNMAKATLESNGKPMIIPMVDVACDPDDTGLLVQFRVPTGDIDTVAGYLDSVVHMGGIKARINGGVAPTVDMSTEPGSYTTDNEWFDHRMFTSRNETIFIRYGTVVYPILRVPGTEKAISLLAEFMGILHIGRILIQAAPSTLGLTPARESLSSGPLTENGLTTLCVDLIARMEKEITADLPVVLAGIEKSLMRGNRSSSIRSHHGIMGRANKTEGLGGLQYKFYSSHLGKDYRTKWNPRLELAEHIGWKKEIKNTHPQHFAMLNRLRHQTKHGWSVFGKPLGEYSHPFYSSIYEELWNTEFLIPALSKLRRSGIDLNTVEFAEEDFYNFDPSSFKRKKGYRKAAIYQKIATSDVRALIDHIENINLVIYAEAAKTETFREIPNLKSDCSRRHAFVLKVDKDADLTTEITKLEKFGIKVTDLRLEHDWDPVVIKRKEAAEKKRLSLEKARETRRAKAAAKAAERAAAGLPEKEHKPRNKNALGTLRSFIGVLRSKQDLHVPEHTSDTPAYYVDQSQFNTNFITKFWPTEWLTEEEKDSIVLVRNGTEARMAKNRGAVNAEIYFAAKLYAIVSEPGFEKYFTKLRRKSLSDEHNISSSLFKDLAFFDIKLPGLDKLIHDKRYEKAMDIYQRTYFAVMDLVKPEGTEEEFLKDEELTKLKLDIPLVAKLKSVRDDSFLQGIKAYTVGTSTSSLRDVAAKYPERSKALKLLVLAAFNK